MSERRGHFEIFRDSRGDWRWRLYAANNRIVADGGEGYASRYNVKRAINAFVDEIRAMELIGLPVVEVG